MWVRIGRASLLVWALADAVVMAQGVPNQEPKEGRTDIDQRLVFLTVQLSTVESSLDATNRNLKMAGYKHAHL